MKVPSYDDLTPGISDVHPRDTFDQVTRLVPCDDPVVRVTKHVAREHVAREHVAREHVAREHVALSTQHTARSLFACLRARTDATAGALLALARDFSPRIERYGSTCVILDVAGLGRLLGDAHGIAAELQRNATDRGLKIRISVAPTHTAARLLTLDTHLPAVCDRASARQASMSRDAEPVVADDVERALAPLALEVLEQLIAKPGAAEAGPDESSSPLVASRTFDALRRWGIRTVGEFAALPPDELAARFGQQGLAIHRLACGIDPRPLLADPGVPRFVQSMELEWPIEELEPLSFVLARLLDPLATALERADKAGAAIRLDLRLVNRTTHARVLQLPAPMRDPRVLRTLLTLDLESHPPAAGIDVVTIEVDPAPSRIVQFSLLERAIPPPETLATLTARLNALIEEDRCGSPILLDSHRPDAFEMVRFNPDDRRRAPTIVEGRERAPVVLRRFRPPIAIRVLHERGHPMHVAIDRRGMPGGRVEQYAGPWRTSGAWWQADGSHWDRDEWDVALSDGSVCRLYRDRDMARWFMEGIFD
jgi:protein ImuB